MTITYTVALDCPNKAVAGKTLTGGLIRKTLINGKAVDVVTFGDIYGIGEILVGIAGKPELEAALAAHNAAQAAAEKKAAEDRAAFEATLEGQREVLDFAERGSYSENHYPGSRAWFVNKKARDALNAFDAAHPEIRAAIEVARKAANAARYDALSDFVKMGS